MSQSSGSNPKWLHSLSLSISFARVSLSLSVCASFARVCFASLCSGSGLGTVFPARALGRRGSLPLSLSRSLDRSLVLLAAGVTPPSLSPPVRPLQPVTNGPPTRVDCHISSMIRRDIFVLLECTTGNKLDTFYLYLQSVHEEPIHISNYHASVPAVYTWQDKSMRMRQSRVCTCHERVMAQSCVCDTWHK